jgi:hypothetical protein
VIIVVLVVKGPVRFLEGDLWISVGEAKRPAAGEGVIDAGEGKGSAGVWQEDIGEFW